MFIIQITDRSLIFWYFMRDCTFPEPLPLHLSFASQLKPLPLNMIRLKSREWIVLKLNLQLDHPLLSSPQNPLLLPLLPLNPLLHLRVPELVQGYTKQWRSGNLLMSNDQCCTFSLYLARSVFLSSFCLSYISCRCLSCSFFSAFACLSFQ